MSLTKLLPVILLIMVTGVQASTRDEIERLWNPQGMAAQPAQPAAGTSARTEKPAPRWFRLSNGRQVNLADWKVVLFMQGHCPYCHQFDPVLKQLAQQYGFSVFPYTLDGQGDTAFPEALPVPPDVMQTFFPNIPVSGMFCSLALRMPSQKQDSQRLLLIIEDSVRVMENEGVWFLQCRPKILFQLSIGQKSRNVLIISVLGYGEHRWEGGMSSVQLRRTNA